MKILYYSQALQEKNMADPFLSLNSSLAQLVEELWRW